MSAKGESLFFDHSPDMLCIVGFDGYFRRVSRSVNTILGWSEAELCGRPCIDLVRPDDRETTVRQMEALGTGKGPVRFANRCLCKDGTYRWIAWNLSPLVGEPAVIGVGRDVTEHRSMEEALMKAKDELEQRVKERTTELEGQASLIEHERDRLMTLLDSMTDGVWLTDAAGKILLSNRVAREQAAEMGLNPETHYGPEMLSHVELFALDGTPFGMETLTRVLQGETLREVEIGVRNRAGGDTFYRRLSVSRVIDREKRVAGAVIVVQDITPQKRAEEEKTRLEEQLRHAQKMEAVGTLAGGIAHDFNNMLAVILGNAELALDDLTGNHEARRSLEQIVGASKRARDLTRQILAFSRKTERGRNPLKLAPLLKETYNMLRGTLPTTIRMELDIGTESDTVLADPSQIQQVLINLATNAAHAMRKNGGVLTFGLSTEHVKPGRRLRDGQLLPGEYVKLSVRDTGTGMTEKVGRRVFEPFFTTKGQGRGTGMGLAVVYGIVKNHEGDITVESKPGQGSVFTVLLPLSHAEAGIQREEAGNVPGGSERILLVDDEPAVLQMTSDILARLGYRVTTAGSGTEAWDLFARAPGSFDLVITDQTMPELTGIDLGRQMLEVRKDIPIILFTGYSETASPEEARKAGIRELVMKPIAKREVAEAVRRALREKD